jgi:hypothetical protein
LVLHDFDKSGFSIFGTWKRDTRRYRFEHRLKVIDLGLRLTDIRDLCKRHGFSLDSLTERVADDDKEKSNEKRRKNLLLNGATPEEAEFLLARRIELNALTSDQLVDFIERKLSKHGIKKIIPATDTLADAYHLFARSRVAEQIIERELAKAGNEPPRSAPRNLPTRVQKFLRENPTMRWDDAIKIVLDETQLESDAGRETKGHSATSPIPTKMRARRSWSR